MNLTSRPKMSTSILLTVAELLPWNSIDHVTFLLHGVTYKVKSRLFSLKCKTFQEMSLRYFTFHFTLLSIITNSHQLLRVNASITRLFSVPSHWAKRHPLNKQMLGSLSQNSGFLQIWVHLLCSWSLILLQPIYSTSPIFWENIMYFKPGKLNYFLTF